MFNINNLQWFGFVSFILRQWLLAKNRNPSVRLSVFVDILWIVWALYAKAWSLVILNIMYVILDIRTIVVWNIEQSVKSSEVYV